MEKALIPIDKEDICEQGFDKYDFYFKVNTSDYEWCTCYLEYCKKKKIYATWLIRVPMDDVKNWIKN